MYAAILKTLDLARRMTALTGVRTTDFLAPVMLGVAATILKLVTLVLFLPLVFGLLGGDFSRLDRRLPISSALGLESPDQIVWVLTLAIVAAALLNAQLDYAARDRVARRAARARSELGRRLTAAFLGYGQQYYDLNRFGALLSKTHRLPRRGEMLFVFLNAQLRSVLALGIYLAAMAWLSPLLTLLVTAMLLAYLYVFQQITQRRNLLDDRTGEAEDDLVAKAGDYIVNLPLVRLAGIGAIARERLDTAGEAVSEAQLEENRVDAAVIPIRELLTMGVLLLFAFAVSRFDNDVDAALVSRYIVFFLLFRRAMGHFSVILSAPASWSKLADRFGRIFALLDESDKFIVPSGTVICPGLGSGIEIRGLNFSYSGKHGVLKGVTLTIPAGRRTVIVGATGSGKSTLFRLLLRQYDCPPGTIFVDGRDIRELDTDSWLRQVAYAGAHPQFFNDTIRHNLSPGDGNVPGKALEEAARQALALSFILEFKQGFDQVIGERGATLSSGEQQRLSLARLFLRDAGLLLLDEATSALDNRTEAAIFAAIDAHAAGRTLVMIAHRLSGLREDDHIIVLGGGSVLEQGSRDELLEAGGSFAEMWRIHEGAPA